MITYTNQPQPNEYPQWAETYISKVEGDVLNLLDEQIISFPKFLNELVEKADYAYAPGKWTIKQLVGHMVDTERILVYRMLCIARGERQSLPGFEEDDYVENAHFQDRSLFSLGEEFALLRKANLFLIHSFREAELNRIGIANDRQISVRAIVWVLAGHVNHHVQIIKERYQ